MKMEQEPLAVLYARLKTSKAGLTNEEAKRRLAEFGPNEPARERRVSGFLQILRFFINPLVIILLIASAVSAAVGELINATIIGGMVLLSVALNIIQTYRSHRAVERLRAGIVLTATACRDGSWVEVPRRDLVPGDVIRLSAGDLVPADARLIQAKDLHVQEAALTGESLPVEKEATEDSAFASISRRDEQPRIPRHLDCKWKRNRASGRHRWDHRIRRYCGSTCRTTSGNRFRTRHTAVRFLNHEDRCLPRVVRFSS